LTQVDAVLCEDHATWRADCTDALIGIDFLAPINPATFDADGFVGVLMELPSRAVH
jgi:hypothetical protein